MILKYPKALFSLSFLILLVLSVACSDEQAVLDELPPSSEPTPIVEVPNGSFEEWDTIVRDGLTREQTYELPKTWIESIIANAFSRTIHGTGFFARYDSTDAEGNALLLTRSMPGSIVKRNNGFNRFVCEQVPNSLKGKYKFSGSSTADMVDTLTIAVHFSMVADTLLATDLHQGKLPEGAQFLKITTPTEVFTDFEIDLSDIAGQACDYATIQFIMDMGEPRALVAEYSRAVIDELQFE